MEKTSGYNPEFNIYKHPSLGLEAVKIGFSFPALLFNIFWILVKKQWDMAILWLLLLLFITANDISLISLIGYPILWLYPAFKGNSWRDSNLVKRGYELLDTINAQTPDAAIAQFVKSNMDNIEKENI